MVGQPAQAAHVEAEQAGEVGRVVEAGQPPPLEGGRVALGVVELARDPAPREEDLAGQAALERSGAGALGLGLGQPRRAALFLELLGAALGLSGLDPGGLAGIAHRSEPRLALLD